MLLLLLEGVFFALGFPQGTSDFIERTLFQNKLELKKPSGQYRIFVYGESTIHGAGYAPFSTPVKWLEAYLHDFLPGHDIKVVNFGRLGEGSAYIVQAFQDTLQYKPDLAIFYMGHNGFYPENRVEFVKRDEAEFSHRLRKWLHKSRLFSAIVRETIKVKIKRHAARIEDTMGEARIETNTSPEENEKGIITLPGSLVYQENVQFFKENIEKIIKAGKEGRIPILFMKPVCNLKNYPPNSSAHLKALSPETLAQWDRFHRQGQEASKKNNDLQALEFFEKAFAIDPTYADLAFRLGQLYFQKGEIEKARAFFEQARDSDVVIRRAPKDILNVFNEFVAQEQIHYYFDTEKALVSHVPGGILGWPIIEDNVHFSIEGHALTGRALADEIAKNDWVSPRSEWRFDSEHPVAEIKKEFGITDRKIFLNYCSVINYLGRRYDERLEFAHRALDLFPEDPTALRQLAWAYWLKGNKEKAFGVYRQLGKIDPTSLETVFRAQPELKQAYESSIQNPVNS